MAGAAVLQGGDLKVHCGLVAAHKLKTLTQMCKHTDVPHACPRSSCADTQTGMQYAYMGTTTHGRKEMSPWPAPDLSYISVPDASEGEILKALRWMEGKGALPPGSPLPEALLSSGLLSREDNYHLLSLPI